jgi:hypothetical protein
MSIDTYGADFATPRSASGMCFFLIDDSFGDTPPQREAEVRNIVMKLTGGGGDLRSACFFAGNDSGVPGDDIGLDYDASKFSENDAMPVTLDSYPPWASHGFTAATTAVLTPHIRDIKAGTRISVWWEKENEWYEGVICTDFHPDGFSEQEVPAGLANFNAGHTHGIEYDDGTAETIDLMEENFRFLPLVRASRKRKLVDVWGGSGCR